MFVSNVKDNYYARFYNQAIKGTEKISVTEVDRQTKYQMDGRMD